MVVGFVGFDTATGSSYIGVVAACFCFCSIRYHLGSHHPLVGAPVLIALPSGRRRRRRHPAPSLT